VPGRDLERLFCTANCGLGRGYFTLGAIISADMIWNREQLQAAYAGVSSQQVDGTGTCRHVLARKKILADVRAIWADYRFADDQALPAFF